MAEVFARPEAQEVIRAAWAEAFPDRNLRDIDEYRLVTMLLQAYDNATLKGDQAEQVVRPGGSIDLKGQDVDAIEIVGIDPVSGDITFKVRSADTVKDGGGKVEEPLPEELPAPQEAVQTGSPELPPPT